MEQQGADPNAPLSDDYLKAHGNDPDVLPLLTSAERRRLSRISGEPRMEAVEPETGVGGFLRRAFPPDRPREDRSVLGMPPEMVPLVGVRAVQAASGAATGMLGRAGAMATEIATPIVKYEVAKSLLMKAGFPEPVATVAAMAVSGYRRNGKPVEPPQRAGRPANATGTSMEPAPMPQPTSASPAASAPGSAPTAAAPPPAPRTPRRTPAAKDSTPPAAKSTKSASRQPSKSSLTPEEERQAAIWLDKGVPVETVKQRILASRQFSGHMNSMTPDEAARAVDRIVKQSQKRRAARKDE